MAQCWLSLSVALRKESVDRNWFSVVLKAPEKPVALRKESVDRNILLTPLTILLIMSLSARRAWIEMTISHHSDKAVYVALRKESVDRNTLRFWPPRLKIESLSARRAWIEICAIC